MVALLAISFALSILVKKNSSLVLIGLVVGGATFLRLTNDDFTNTGTPSLQR